MSEDTPVDPQPEQQHEPQPEQAEAVALGEVAIQDIAPPEQVVTEHHESSAVAPGHNPEATPLRDTEKADQAEPVTKSSPHDTPETSDIFEKALAAPEYLASPGSNLRDSKDSLKSEMTESNDPAKNQVKEDLEELNDRLDRVIEEQSDPYVEFYDLNPKKFGPMPTSEFMKSVENYSHLCESLDRQHKTLQSLSLTIEDYEEFLQKESGEPISYDSLADMVYPMFFQAEGDKLQEYIHINDKDGSVHPLKMLDDKFKSIENSSFDKSPSPREIIEGQLELMQEYVELAQQSIEDNNGRKKLLEEEVKNSASDENFYGQPESQPKPQSESEAEPEESEPEPQPQPQIELESQPQPEPQPQPQPQPQPEMRPQPQSQMQPPQPQRPPQPQMQPQQEPRFITKPLLQHDKDNRLIAATDYADQPAL